MTFRKKGAALAEFASASTTTEWSIPTKADWDTMSIDSANTLVQKLMAAYQEGAGIVNQRVYNAARESGVFRCLICGKKKPITVGEGSNARPGYVWRDDRPDPQSGIYTMRAICSQDCHFRGSNSGKLTNAGTPANVHK